MGIIGPPWRPADPGQQGSWDESWRKKWEPKWLLALVYFCINKRSNCICTLIQE